MVVFLFEFFEKAASFLLGKGWGSSTISHEVRAASSFLCSDRPMLFVDIGGNKGNYTGALIQRFPDSRVFVFEPSTSNCLHLETRFAQAPTVSIVRAALSDQPGQATLFSDKEGSGLASLSDRRLDHMGLSFDHEEQIEVMVFEDFWRESLGRSVIDFCKLDVEGHELSVLRGMGEALHHIKVIQFEFGGCNIDTRTFFQDFWYFFTERNFQLFRICPVGLIEIKKYKELDERFSTTNYLAVRK